MKHISWVWWNESKAIETQSPVMVQKGFSLNCIIFLTNPCTRHICFGFFNDLFWISWQLFWDFSVKVFWQVQKVWCFLRPVGGYNPCTWHVFWDFSTIGLDFSVKVFFGRYRRCGAFPHQLEDIIHALGTVTRPHHCCWIMVDDFLLASLVLKNFHSAHIF